MTRSFYFHLTLTYKNNNKKKKHNWYRECHGRNHVPTINLYINKTIQINKPSYNNHVTNLLLLKQDLKYLFILIPIQ